MKVIPVSCERPLTYVSPRPSLFPSVSPWETMRVEGKQNLLFPAGPDIESSVISHNLELEQIINLFHPLKCHCDQNFGIPCFYIFEHSLWFLVTMPNFNLLRRLEVAFFGRFLSRFCGRHHWPLFRKLACE